MKEPLDLVIFVLAMAAATQVTRFLPFLLPAAWLDNAFVDKLKVGLPAVILLLLVIYSVKDTPLNVAPWGANEAIALSVVVLLHLWRKNALLSIGIGTALYMVLVQTAWLNLWATL